MRFVRFAGFVHDSGAVYQSWRDAPWAPGEVRHLQDEHAEYLLATFPAAFVAAGEAGPIREALGAPPVSAVMPSTDGRAVAKRAPSRRRKG